MNVSVIVFSFRLLLLPKSFNYLLFSSFFFFFFFFKDKVCVYCLVSSTKIF